jgi:hypothetical protein
MMLLAGRALQAVGAGPVLSKAIAKETFSPLNAQARAFRYFFGQRGCSSDCAAGRGFDSRHLSWNSLFLVMALFSVVTLLLSPRALEQHDAAVPSLLPGLSPRHLSRDAAGFTDPEFAVLLYLAVSGHFYAAVWSEYAELFLAFLSFRTVFYPRKSDGEIRAND